MKKMLLASALVTMMGGACAQAYVGGALGVAHADFDCKGTTSCDKSDTSFKLYGGYKINDIWAAELGYANFGKTKATVYVPAYALTAAGELENTAFTLALAGRTAIAAQLNAAVRVGLARVRSEGTVTVLSTKVSASETKIKPYLGLGLEYVFTKSLSATLGVDLTQGELYSDTYNLTAFNVGVQYGF